MFRDISIPTILVSYVALLLSLSIHEASHSTAAYLLGDDTSKRLGRMTINPIAHMDLVGTLIFPLLGMFTGFPFIGWAKPVPVNGTNLTRKLRMRVGFALVAGAGPGINLVLALLFMPLTALLARLFSMGIEHRISLFVGAMGDSMEHLRSLGAGDLQTVLLALCGRLAIINILLALFNLLPLGPLDGANILRGIVPAGWVGKLDRIQPFMFVVLLIGAFTGVLSIVIRPVLGLVYALLLPIARLILGV